LLKSKGTLKNITIVIKQVLSSVRPFSIVSNFVFVVVGAFLKPQVGLFMAGFIEENVLISFFYPPGPYLSSLYQQHLPGGGAEAPGS